MFLLGACLLSPEPSYFLQVLEVTWGLFLFLFQAQEVSGRDTTNADSSLFRDVFFLVYLGSKYYNWKLYKLVAEVGILIAL